MSAAEQRAALEEAGAGAVLRCADLRGRGPVDLRARTCAGDLSGAGLTGAVLWGARPAGAALWGASMEYAEMEGGELEGALVGCEEGRPGAA
jgi:uncharacterized protein YjbI with pentapeptide repeats